jgi:hypothetical protein
VCVRCNKELVGKQTRFCSLSCRNTFTVTKKCRQVKDRAVEYKGGKCADCGYDRCVAALQFHHPNGDKAFGIAPLRAFLDLGKRLRQN